MAVIAASMSLGRSIYERRCYIHPMLAQFERLGGVVEFHPNRIWGLNLVAGRFFDNVRSVDLSRTNVTDMELTEVHRLRRLERLYLTLSLIHI